MAQISASDSAYRPPAPPAPRQSLFRQFLSELNPLQYIPVIGTLYRAVTHDTIPQTAREAGSLVVSFLTGGPVGVALNLGALAAEKLTDIDPEKLGEEALASLGIGKPAATGAGTPVVHEADNAATSASATPIAAAPIAAASAASTPAVSTPAVTTHAFTTHAVTTPAAAARPWSTAQLAAYGVTTSTHNELVHGSLKGSDVLNDLVLSSHRPQTIA